jgi:mannitol/fructose-specific phosphotransferase system IIA component (Ntr-type)
MTLADLLRPEYVQLRPVATSRDAAIREIAALLENDVKVLDWEEMHRRVTASAPCVAEPGASFCMCLPHARTAAVTELVMSAGRFDPGLSIANVKQPVRYLFCIAVPPEMATDYLRIIGLLARIVKDPDSETQIHTAATPEDFIETLARLEAKL